MRISKADLLHVKKFLDNYETLVNGYPEIFKNDELDEYKIVKQLIEEKLTNEQ